MGLSMDFNDMIHKKYISIVESTEYCAIVFFSMGHKSWMWRIQHGLLMVQFQVAMAEAMTMAHLVRWLRVFKDGVNGVHRIHVWYIYIC